MRKSSGRRTNLALLLLLPTAVVTGLVANGIGTDWAIHPSVIHGIVAMAILILSPWKQAIVRRGLGRRRATWWVSVMLLVVVLATLSTGVMHAVGYTGGVGPLTLMQVHVGGAVIALLLAFLHYRSHPVRLRRPVDVDRRAFLRAGTLTGAAAVLWIGLERALDVFDLPGGDRRFTGSHERSSHDPSRFPVTSWLDDRVQVIAETDWALTVDDVVHTLGDIEKLPHETFDAVLDCTSAWYSTQRWAGVRLTHLLDPGAHRSVVVTSRTGYSRRFPTRDLDRMWLATHVGGRPLSAGHGYPARIVAPGRRGFWWVKWVVEIRTSDVPWWAQLPFPVT
ncbi:MAG: molybdopterin-dependent oxidoreductase [Acidimicrobiia bacterium]|jgi:DMSO/TMAO reductase YedYZ molybdopterin-dependent catalytic subunit